MASNGIIKCLFFQSVYLSNHQSYMEECFYRQALVNPTSNRLVVGCRVKSNCLLVGPRTIDRMLSVGIFLRDPNTLPRKVSHILCVKHVFAFFLSYEMLQENICFYDRTKIWRGTHTIFSYPALL